MIKNKVTHYELEPGVPYCGTKGHTLNLSILLTNTTCKLCKSRLSLGGYLGAWLRDSIMHPRPWFVKED